MGGSQTRLERIHNAIHVQARRWSPNPRADAGADTAAMSSEASITIATIPNPFGFVLPFMLFSSFMVHVLSLPEARPKYNHRAQLDHAFGWFLGFGLLLRKHPEPPRFSDTCCVTA